MLMSKRSRLWKNIPCLIKTKRNNMNKQFKKNLLELKRYRTSTGRDIEGGLCLDRNERVSKFAKIIKDIAKKCQKHDVMFFVDEAYAFLGGESAISLIDDFENLVVFQTMSKAFGLAGVRLGWMVSNQKNIDYFSKTRALVESNGVTLVVAKYMIENIDILKEYVSDLKQGLTYLRRELTTLGIKSFGGDYTNSTLLFMDNEDDANSALEYLRERKIYVRASFKEPFNNCLRITLGPRDSMKKFLKYFNEWLQNNRMETE